jgi:hypothetical protein
MIGNEPGAGAVLASLPALSEPRVRRSTAAQRLHCLFVELFCRTHELECVNNLFAVRMLVNLASGSVGEFVLVMCRNRIAEHQRVNDPDCTWLHCLTPHVRWTAPRERAPRTHSANCCRVAEQAHRANSSRPQGKLPCAHVRAASARVAPSLWALRGSDGETSNRRGNQKVAARSPPQRERQRGAERTSLLIARVAF